MVTYHYHHHTKGNGDGDGYDITLTSLSPHPHYHHQRVVTKRGVMVTAWCTPPWCDATASSVIKNDLLVI
ncbi:hypothetical protein E2C01_101473 [Portunus trituberculatus]|uniref:Uncharacterized protein n=1 Tax=Portunus trituberculatus TaxID=210409 RepID=A0A5B7KAU4_PORTR|nr:hypothetical protein [Portunus trituberculatus]